MMSFTRPDPIEIPKTPKQPAADKGAQDADDNCADQANFDAFYQGIGDYS